MTVKSYLVSSDDGIVTIYPDHLVVMGDGNEIMIQLRGRNRESEQDIKNANDSEIGADVDLRLTYFIMCEIDM